MITCTSHLSSTQLTDLHKLAGDVAQQDGYTPSLYIHLLEKKRDCEGSVLFYENNELVGFLAAFFFYEHACEVAMMVSPKYRRQKISIQMLKTILPLLKEREMNQIIFSMVADLNRTWIQDLGCTFRQSDYHMDRFNFNPILIASPQLTIRQAQFQDVATLAEIEANCFEEIHSEPFVRYANLVYDPDYTILLALYNQLPVGKAHIRWEAQHAQFFDIGILPNYRGRGFGSELVAFCINESLRKGKSKQSLDVISTNQSAIAIYKKLGFKTTMHHEYWQVNLPKLTQWLEKQQ